MHICVFVLFPLRQLFNDLESGCMGIVVNIGSLDDAVCWKIEGATKELKDIQIVI